MRWGYSPFDGRKRRTGREKYSANVLVAVRANAACKLAYVSLASGSSSSLLLPALPVRGSAAVDMPYEFAPSCADAQIVGTDAGARFWKCPLRDRRRPLTPSRANRGKQSHEASARD